MRAVLRELASLTAVAAFVVGLSFVVTGMATPHPSTDGPMQIAGMRP